MTSKLLFHIGYHKTATTWMQRQLFMPIHGYQQIADHNDVSKYIVAPHGLYFDPGLMSELIIKKMETTPTNQVAVVSSELICGNPFFGGRESDVFAERVHQVFPRAKILVTIRSQKKILLSTYMQYLSRGGRMTPDQFFYGPPNIGYYGFDPVHFEYDRLVKLYQNLFGLENVFVSTQEDLKLNQESTLSLIAKFCENKIFTTLTEANKQRVAASYPEYAVPFLRRANHFRKSALNPKPVFHLSSTDDNDLLYRAVGHTSQSRPMKVLFRNHRPVSEYIDRKFSESYSKSNSLLAKILPYELNLSKYW